VDGDGGDIACGAPVAGAKGKEHSPFYPSLIKLEDGAQ
jgi:hypothetical protein